MEGFEDALNRLQLSYTLYMVQDRICLNESLFESSQKIHNMRRKGDGIKWTVKSAKEENDKLGKKTLAVDKR